VSLRARLFGLVVGVFAVGLLLAGLAVKVLVSDFLIDRLDRNFTPAQLAALAEAGNPFPEVPDREGPLRQVDGAWVRVTTPGGVTVFEGFLGAELTPPRQVPDLPDDLTDRHGTPFGVDGVGPGQETSYRVLAEVSPIGSLEIVAALPTDEVRSTVNRIVLVEFLVGGVVLALVAAAAWTLIGVGLRPLRRMEDSAQAIADSGYPAGARIDHPPERTELGRLGTTLNEMLTAIDSSFDQREEADARLRRFVSDASHELRTPLTSIRGYAQLVERSGYDPDTTTSSLARIRSESERMTRLVEDLLTLARLDEQPALVMGDVDLADLAHEVVADVRAVDPDRTWTVHADTAVEARGDRARLAQAVLNLVMNASQHTAGGTPVEVVVRTERDVAVIDVVDHGAGLSEEHRAKVFDRFYRTDLGRTRTAGGSGLGLAIVAGIAQAHGGSVTAGPTPGSGTTFSLALPSVAFSRIP
jgi:two-component system, OmpR family, sensor kinase